MSFLKQLTDSANRNGYKLYKSESKDPELIFFRNLSYGRVSWNYEEIEMIVRENIQDNENVFVAHNGSEGKATPIISDEEFGGTSDLFYFLKKKNCSLYFNDSWVAYRWFNAASHWTHFALKVGSGDKVLKSMDDAEESIKERIEHLYKGPFGLSKFDGKKYQIVNDQLWQSKYFFPTVYHSKLPYALFISNVEPGKNEIEKYWVSLQILEDGNCSEEKKLNALLTISKYLQKGATISTLKKVVIYPINTMKVRQGAENLLKNLDVPFQRIEGDKEY